MATPCLCAGTANLMVVVWWFITKVLFFILLLPVVVVVQQSQLRHLHTTAPPAELHAGTLRRETHVQTNVKKPQQLLMLQQQEQHAPAT
ncbi:hypothetical protein R1flu_017398 [Riccia fluitans]|uniref:Secreted protein n=1 Tax=Riccia fluitans TaxID=41844 RepID=A0ABD1ZD54_9MARC